MKTRSGQKLKLTSVEELLGVPNEESSIEIEIDRIRDFKDHPFKVLDDEKMDDLVESIRRNGVLSPVIVRPTEEDTYEMVSGHRRMHACKLVGLTMIPAIVREMTDDEAVVYMVDSNIQREELLPSEKAFAFKMKMDALRRQGSRQSLTSRQNGEKLSCDVLGEDVEVSELMDYDSMKENLMIQVVPTEGNEELLAGIPHQEQEDILAVSENSMAESVSTGRKSCRCKC